ncbi:hypothetical protein DACRYDRAFT_24219 [Dacryopinax primogenitus]|uniref:60S ribosomal protein L20 n=1 Tax=Dacryopinax primogenitus (strain DJM 731) TaxID=1858805 RepID=M5FTA0_DACPD|nr:uncharacterized protein DACRYDRAFT_24219 [Dacryopinax primogenitus]EJT98609.1 hypothetical protein DACRYDRAFT_24219 [Dacryopinax primogenitus]
MSLPLIFKRGYVVRALPRQPDPLKASPRAKTWTVAPGVTFTHNPPPSVPSPFSLTSAPASPLLALGPRTRTTEPSTINELLLPPRLHRPPKARVALTDGQVAEIRKLRAHNQKPYMLAKQFGVSEDYIRLLAPLKRSQRIGAIAKARAKEEREDWGFRKRVIRAIREKRKDFWSLAPRK